MPPFQRKQVGDPYSADTINELQIELERVVGVYLNGALVGVRPRVNLVPGTNVELVVVDNAALEAIDITISATAGAGGGSAALLVAASDAPAAVIARADYQCDGTADEVQINQAIAAAGDGHAVELSAGIFTLANPVAINGKDRFTLRGNGAATQLRPVANETAGTTTFPAGRALIEYGYGDGASAAFVEDIWILNMALNGRAQAGKNNSPSLVQVHGIMGGAYKARIHNVDVEGFSGWGIRQESPNSSNKTDLQLGYFYIGHCRQGGLYLGAAATDAHIHNFVVMHSGKIGNTAVQAASPGIDVRAASIQFDEFQTYGQTGWNFLWNNWSKMSRISNGKIETSTLGGINFLAGAGMVNIAGGTNFRGGNGSTHIKTVSSEQSIICLDGVIFQGDSTAKWPDFFLDLGLNANSKVYMTGGGMFEHDTGDAGWTPITKIQKSGTGEFKALNVINLTDQTL